MDKVVMDKVYMGLKFIQSMKIRKFRVQDTPSIANLIKNTFLKYNGRESSRVGVQRYVSRYDSQRLPELADKLKEDPLVLVATENEKVIGVVRGEEHRVFQLFVDKKHHRKGIGRQLMRSFEEKVKKEGSRYVDLLLGASPQPAG